MREVVARFTWLTGGQHFPPRWSLGFGITSMSIADAPDADARVTAFIAECRRHDIPCDSFHFGSGYSSIGDAALLLQLEPRQVSRSGGDHASG